MDKGKGKEKECFSSDRLFSRKRTVENANVDVELKLNDPKKSKLLNRSTSVTYNGIVYCGEKNEFGFQFSVIRMSSLPVETEEELRQRKEIEFLNRLEAKQRLENMKKARAVKAIGNSSLRLSGGSQGSVTCTETQKLAIQGASGSGSGSDSTVRAVASDVSLEEGMFRNLMLNMPLVSTRCVGPNGEKTQGQLVYEYKEGEEVKIVCVCHGYILSPAEFVKHAGGGDVENPLRHITIKHVANW